MKKTKGRVSAGDVLRDEVPDSDVVPDGGYLVGVASMGVGETGNNAKTPGCKMFSVQYSIKEPKEYKGTPLFDNFVIGNEDDPDAQRASTWKASRGAKAMKRMLTAAQVPLEGEEDQLCEGAKGQTLFLVVVCQTDTRDDSPYKGTQQNRVRGYYAEGEREPEVTGEVAVAPKGGVKAALKKKRVEEDDEDDEEEDEAPPVKKKKVVAEEEEEEEEEEDDAEEEAPKKRGRPKGSKNKAKVEEEDDDEDEEEEEEEDEAPPKKRRA